jgi:phage baseplate assembly protein W
MSRNTKTFSDLDLNFIAHPVTKDISIKYDDQAIKASVRNLILTSYYERPFHPEIGSPIRGLMFELNTPMLPIMVQKAVAQTIENFEPRVRLINVTAKLSPDDISLYVTIEFMILNTSTVQSVSVILNRTR